MRIVTAAEMKELDRRAIEEYGIPSLDLMEKAATCLVRAVMDEADEGSVLALCGPGNNGGDGLAAARMLVAEGFAVTVLLAAPPTKLTGDALAQYRIAVESGVRVLSVEDKEYERLLESPGEWDVVVDALLGTGARGAPAGEIERLVSLANSLPSPTVSADIPTGLDCDTGVAEGAHILAERTMTFGLPKPFLFQNDGLFASGEWFVGDIGFPEELVENAGNAWMPDEMWAMGRFPTRTRLSHKRNSGVVLVVAGSAAFPGAAVLTAQGALRSGAGLVLVASVPEALDAVKAHLPECPLVALPSQDGWMAPDAADTVAAAAERCDSVAVGPGLGREPCVRDFLKRLFSAVETRWVVDADALFWLPELKTRPRGVAVLTPHEGEAARLSGLSADAIRAARFASVRTLAEKYDQTVLLKGAYSLIASPGSDIAVNPTGNPILATGGTGDVLTGAIATFLALGGPPYETALAAAYMHGAAGDLVADELDASAGALASEIAAALPLVPSAVFDSMSSKILGDNLEFDEEDDSED
ncbi:MAG: NAD(P)H-hydrate dehydratase [Armatimonadetes bacterium]|nr:NAD(P)H-hydrate dehydratase [Armatimonadota bacterium]